MKITNNAVMTALSNVLDPELNISIVDLGLVYSTKVTDEKGVYIEMTLTTLGCPLFNVIEGDIKRHVGALGVDDDKIEIELTFDPPWSMERMSESAKAMLGI
jgi:metal-sulfur cluster biosynthetic enzyme